VSVIIWLIVEIILTVFCVIIAIWCILVYIICYVGCLGMKGCVDNCINNAPTATSVEITWDYPTTDTGSNKGGLTDPGGPGSGTGTGTGRGTRPNPYSRHPKTRITRIGQLEEQVRWSRLFVWLTPMQLELPNVSQEQAGRLQSTIDRYVAACGCREGQIGALLAALAFVAFLLARPGAVETMGWPELRLASGVLLGGALVGKMSGVLRARLLLRKSVQLFARALQP
jgi:hypothetical protein